MNESLVLTAPHADPSSGTAGAIDAERCPRLAEGVRLHGQMPGVGFTTPQWLIERNGQFLQVSELLYRVAEQMDGTRTAADIAALVTANSEWALGSEHVHHLIAKKLRPLGLVTASEAATTTSSDQKFVATSPLRLNMRARLLPQGLIDRLASVLQYAHAPGLLIPIAVSIAAAHWWLYAGGRAEHGVESAFYQPGAMGALLLLTIAGGLFHELGHSSALRYGGGKPRGIGFGLYLVFPAFYSDVTDSYRLSRAARIRTDLGGIYFHFIFAAVLIGIAAWTGSTFLLAAAILFNIEALRQFIPLVRLDGYWLLADLTGVPDFLSQIRTFAKSVRRRSQQTPSGPQFKRWVTVAFGLYLLLSIPATVYLVALMIGYLPELGVLTQKALTVQMQLWSTMEDPLTRVLIALQIGFLPLPIAATSYFLYLTFVGVIAQIAARRGWNSTAFPVRRVAGASAFAAGAAFAAVAMAPPAAPLSAPIAVFRGGQIDPTVLLQRVQDATRSVHTMEADVEGTFGAERITGTLALSRPNQARVEVHGSADSLGTFSVVSDGEKLFVFFPEDKKYTEAHPGLDGSNINAFIVDQVRIFFKPDRLAPAAGYQLTYAGQERLQDGGVFHVVEKRAMTRDGATWRYYISPHDHLLRRVAMTETHEGKTSSRVIQLANLRLNRPVEHARFQWKPPADATTLDLGILGVALPVAGSQK